MGIEGYITREGRFIDVSNIQRKRECSNHLEWCRIHKVHEDELLNERFWVKLSMVIPMNYIFYGRHLTVEQANTLRKIGIDPYDEDLV